MVGEGLAERFGWKLGDRIPIQGTIFPGTWEFNVRAIYRGGRPQDDTTQFWFRWDYLDERKPFGKGFVGWYTVRVTNPDDAVRVARDIDEQFANSPFETKTDTEKAFAASFVKQMGNIEFLILSIGSVVFFTLLLVTGNTMAIAVRERVRELAVLKAVGFSDGFVLGLVLAETLVVAAVGGRAGALPGEALHAAGRPDGRPPSILLSSAPRRWRWASPWRSPSGSWPGSCPPLAAMRLRVVDALRRV